MLTAVPSWAQQTVIQAPDGTVTAPLGSVTTVTPSGATIVTPPATGGTPNGVNPVTVPNAGDPAFVVPAVPPTSGVTSDVIRTSPATAPGTFGGAGATPSITTPNTSITTPTEIPAGTVNQGAPAGAGTGTITVP
ncbi:hypothetical protein ACN4EK_28090 [Pantanalinema rosaneae CENA516]